MSQGIICTEGMPTLDEIKAEVFPDWREVQRECITLAEILHENRRTALQQAADESMRGRRFKSRKGAKRPRL